MKTWKKILGLACGLAATLLPPSCRTIGDKFVDIWADHFVWEFYEGCNLSLLVEDSICAIYLSRDGSGERYASFRVTSGEEGEPLRGAHPKALERCEALGDVGFNEQTSNPMVMFAPYEFHKYPYSPIASVDIRAYITLFGGVPAGEPLNDWFEFLSFSPDEYIRAGYRADVPRIAACRDTLPPALHKPFLCGIPLADVNIQENLRHPDAISPENREMAALPVYGRLSEIPFENYECLGMDIVLGVLRPVVPIDSMRMAQLQVTVRFRDGNTRVAKVKWDGWVHHFLHGGENIREWTPKRWDIVP